MRVLLAVSAGGAEVKGHDVAEVTGHDVAEVKARGAVEGASRCGGVTGDVVGT